MTSIKAVFVRGGTSKGLVFHERDLPLEQAEWDPVFLRAMGSPDPYGRQLDGMGGGVSSLSKVCVVRPSPRRDADVDYTFAQIQIGHAAVNYSGNCGNMASAVGPFAVDEGLVEAPSDGTAVVRMHNLNTGKTIRSAFAVRAGRSVREGSYRLQGVAGTGSPVRLDFLDPGGTVNGRLLPVGEAMTRITVGGVSMHVSMVDSANPVVFVRAAELGLRAVETPDELDAGAEVLLRLEEVRRTASVLMGIAADAVAAAKNPTTPFVAVVGPPAAFRTLGGDRTEEEDVDLSVRFLSNGQPHRALPLTGALCTAVAAQVPGSVVHESARHAGGDEIRLGSPSGPIEVAASVSGSLNTAEGMRADYATAFRTTRRLFSGYVEL
ncbi:PrpF domain-containing protein [Streptomyces sp. ITFR-16]|uniref:PrpF domain-containing protein n=1 Tax=Streptomyces sp. ITFR-16 TaxID=3075198 RepID=UPI00288A0664|nr:PrpF domain-containing protein [Streptomyces sp. ITFR-16]WNI21435.1 PrpF domain-containing protein [Streptomyces sp. ITFR-16]